MTCETLSASMDANTQDKDHPDSEHGCGPSRALPFGRMLLTGANGESRALRRFRRTARPIRSPILEFDMGAGWLRCFVRAIRSSVLHWSGQSGNRDFARGDWRGASHRTDCTRPKAQLLRVLIDIASIGAGGAERQAIYLTAGLAARGHSALLIVNKRVLAYHREALALGIDVLELGHDSRLDPRLLPDLVQCIRVFRPDVVLCVMFNATFWGRLASILTNTPAVVAQHSTRTRHRAAAVLSNRALAPFTRAVVACADAQKPALVLSGHRAARIEVIHNGIDVNHFVRSERARRAVRRELGIDETCFVVGLVAGHRVEKRHDRFIEVMERLVSAGTDVWGIMAGDGALLETNLGLVERSSAAARLQILGARNDLEAVYSACDAVALVSDDVEAFPLCLLEAQACGVPVVAMDVGGVGETFTDQKTGFLIPQGDFDGMTDALALLAGDPELRSRMGAEARHLVEEEYTMDRMARQYAEVLERAARSHA